ncbi:MAG: TonB-dependent receptor [Methylococcales bacterium]|nr:TonB-dependent receptor [Methylococcales bacterium]
MNKHNLTQSSYPLFKLSAIAAVLVGVMPLAVMADSSTQHFNIPAQPLDNALTELADSANLKLVYPVETVKNQQSHAVSGSYSPQQALQKLLVGTGITAHSSANGAIMLAKVDNKKEVANPPSSADATTLKTVNVTDKTVWDATDPYNKGYAVPNSSTATKTDTPIMETPMSVQVVPRAVMDDQKVTRLADVLENVSGVRPQQTLGMGNNFIVRGFFSQNIYRNGLKSNDDFPVELDTANLQSVEVLKGPAQLYGRTEPGGLINLTTKKPLDVPYYSLEQRFGSYDLYRTEWDATGPIDKDKTLLYRFTGSYQNNNSFRDFVFNNRMLFAPSLTWRPTESTDATIELQVVDQDFRSDFGIPAIGNRPASIPISRSLDDPNTPKSQFNQVQLNTLFNHRFNEDWAIHNRFLASFDNANQTFVNPAPAFDPAGALDQTTGIMQRNVFREEDSAQKYTTNIDLTGKFNLGFTKHDVLLGFDFYRAFHDYGTTGFWNAADPALAINIYNPAPSYGIPQSVINTALMQTQRPGRNQNTFYNQWEGIYFQDQITLWDKLHIMGGGRYDWTETGRGRGGSYSAATADIANSRRFDSGFSPRVGILYDPIKELSFYGNWTTSFGANNGISATGASFDPQIGEQFEAGIKTSLFNDRLLATLAYYHLTKENLLTPDLSTADTTDSIAIGKQRSQGIELDVTGQITNGLSLIGSYAYTDARVTKDASGYEGKRLSNVPENAGSLWLKYDFSVHEPLNGLSVGVGGVAAGQREGNIDNTFQLPGYVRMDAFAAYQWHIKKSKVTAQINIRNLLDKQYYESTDPELNIAPALAISPGAPLMAVGSVRVEF